MKNNKKLFGGALHAHYRTGDRVRRTQCVNTTVESLTIIQQYKILQSLAGVKSPIVYSCSNTTMEMQFISGKVLKTTNANHHMEIGKQLAMIHSFDTAKMVANGTIKHTPISQRIGKYVKILKQGEMLFPALKYFAQWLKDNEPVANATATVPSCTKNMELTLIHGDYRLGNLLFIDNLNTPNNTLNNGLIGVLDWEFAHLGNRAEDLGWMFSDFWDGDTYQQVILDSYNTTMRDLGCDSPVVDSDIRYWKIFSYVRFSAIACGQYERAKTEKDIEFAVTGWQIWKGECLLSIELKKQGNPLVVQDYIEYKLPSNSVFYASIIPSLKQVFKGERKMKCFMKDLIKGIRLYLFMLQRT